MDKANERSGALASYRRAGPEKGHWAVLSILLLVGLVYGFYFGLLAPYVVLPFLVPVAALAGLVIWALPEMRGAPVGLLSGLLIAFLIALPLWPNYLAIGLPGMPWITVLRIISGPMILLLFVCLSISPEFRSRMRESIMASAPVWAMLVMFVAIQFLSLGLSVVHGGGLGESIEAFIVAQINWTAIFFMSAYVFLRPGRAQFLVMAMLLAAVVLALIGVQEWRHGTVPWAGHIPSFLKIEDPIVQNVLNGSARAATGVHRVQATYTTSLGFAEFLALMTPFILHFVVQGRQLWLRLAAALFLPLSFWVIMLTDSRLGIVGYFLSFLFYLFIHGLMKWRSERRGMIGPAIVIAYPLLFTGFIFATFFVPRLSRMVWGGGAASYSTQARIEQYDKGFDLILHNPLGYGIGRGGITLGYVNQAGVGTIDSYYLLILLEYGIVGFLIFYGLFLVGIWKAGRALFDMRPADQGVEWELSLLIPLTIALGNWIVIKSIFAQADNGPLVFAMLGMATALIWRVRNQSTQSGVPRRPASPSRQPARP
ncbi:O-antigen ligase family protein [Rhizorhapis sp. SPR117]|uniref:O-antigen ligase family protein n=1 Tax=Rhizorhapis sp. SPR117 TaxID=2912611 RepID=UPI001F289CBD|nr:O-antigen ligase family protein [Rhizorhapis sp. SPR117]